ncbi:MAG: pyrimidine 5'-nucleotidase [Robiginitomaculum sp.]|nr:MAG: pyrimidine 5'-nucleotidase [Robiginitomaculum sp.]
MVKLDHIDAWIFDLDNTLYSGDADFFAQIDKKITSFISDFLSLPPTEARILQKQYLVKYGTSLSGLMAEHGMDPADYLDHVHDINLDVLIPDPDLAIGIENLPGRKFIFTNGSRGHAKRVGDHLGIYDLFDGVFAIEDIDYIPKPKRGPYEKFISAFDIDPKKSFMAEDSVRNLEAPKAMGMSTLLITSQLDWSHEPKAARPHDGKNVPHFVDMHTNDLTGWLLKLM